MKQNKYRAWGIERTKGDNQDKQIMLYQGKLFLEEFLKQLRIQCIKWELIQFTGLKDKNGKEIYEGDIVKWTHLVEGRFYETHKITDILEVKWEDDEAKFSISGLSCFDRKDMLMKDLEVIGNIWEDKHLLKNDM